MTIWDQYANEIKSAAYTGSLAKFVSSICSRLGATLGRTEAEHAVVESILTDANDRAVLKMLREETTLLVLMVRVDNQESRAKWEEENQ